MKLYWKVSGRLWEGYSSLIKKEREGQEDMSSSPLPVLSFPALDILCDDVFLVLLQPFWNHGGGHQQPRLVEPDGKSLVL